MKDYVETLTDDASGLDIIASHYLVDSTVNVVEEYVKELKQEIEDMKQRRAEELNHFIEISKQIEVLTPYGKGTFLRAHGLHKSVTLNELLSDLLK